MRADLPVPIWASPLNTSPVDEWSTASWALLVSTLGFQPAMVPSSVAKRKLLAAVFPLAATLKPVPLCWTMPVGGEEGPAGGGGIVITSGGVGGMGAPA